MSGLKPFWRYYGGKWRAAPRYPAPRHRTIIEPFAGAAGYSVRYPDHDVILVDKYPVITELWRYLIQVSSAEIMRIPEVQAVDDLPAWVPQPARHLVGWWMNAATVSPCRTLSAGRRRMAELGCRFEGWTPATRERVATQVGRIRHWRVIEGDYYTAPTKQATWFIDPPYSNLAGSHYVHSSVDYEHLADWSRAQAGQVIVCENVGANWLPFRSFGSVKSSPMSRRGGFSAEAIWTNDNPMTEEGAA